MLNLNGANKFLLLL